MQLCKDQGDQTPAPNAAATSDLTSTQHMESDHQTQFMEMVSADAPEHGLETHLTTSDSNTQSPVVPPVDERDDHGPDALSTSLEIQSPLAVGDPNASDDYEPPEPFTDGRAELDAVPFDSAPVEIANNGDIQTSQELQNNSESMTISTGSDSNHYPASEQRIEMVDTSREVHLV